MNVIIVNDNAHVNGGAAKVAIQEAVGLAQRGHRVYFVCAVAPIAHELLHPNIEVCCTFQHDLKANPNSASAFAQGWWNVKAAELMRKLLGRLTGSKTIVHLHVWSRALSTSVIKVALDGRLPLVCTLHDFILACPNGTFFNHTQQDICGLSPLSTSCILTNCDTRSYPQKLWRVGRQVIQKHLCAVPSAIRHVIAHSALAADVLQPFLPSECTIHRLPIYSNNVKLSPARPESNQGLVYVGRLVREKGVLLVANAAAAEGIAVTFVGSGHLEEQIREIYPDAHVTGWVDSSKSVRFLREARALVFPSLWYETLGLVVLEAAAHGVPSLVPDRSAAREVVLDGITGLHFRSGDEADLRAKIRQLQDPAFVRALGRAAYEAFWSSEYGSLSAHISSLEAIYQLVLETELIQSTLSALPMEIQHVS